MSNHFLQIFPTNRASNPTKNTTIVIVVISCNVKCSGVIDTEFWTSPALLFMTISSLDCYVPIFAGCVFLRKEFFGGRVFDGKIFDGRVFDARIAM